ncbi:hypothetical protein TNCV_2537381 [Trichonephila clavipes]|nr:hypothetical protein TNCV_2537381 [Trichonephila clavipes]
MIQEGVCAWWSSADTATEDDHEKHFSFVMRGLYNVFSHAVSVRVHMISLLRPGSPLVTLGLTIDEYAHKGSTILCIKGGWNHAKFRRMCRMRHIFKMKIIAEAQIHSPAVQQ